MVEEAELDKSRAESRLLYWQNVQLHDKRYANSYFYVMPYELNSDELINRMQDET